MAVAESRIWTEVDFAADGKQVAYLHLPHSVTRSAYGTIAIPVAVIGKGEGRTILLTAGNHGDEFEGQVTLTKLIRALEAEDIAGRVIILPALNLPAAMAGTRVSPIDGGNLNRSFPGDPDGGPTAQIAYYLDSVIVPMCDAWLDLHSGGSSLDYVPLASAIASGDAELDARCVELLRVFGAPLSMIWDVADPAMAGATALRHKLLYVGTELGGAGAVRPDWVKLSDEGVIRSLRHLGILKNADKFPTTEAPATRLTQLSGRDYFVYAPEAGLFEWHRNLGEEVQKGETAGCIHFVDNPAREPVAVTFRRDGTWHAPAGAPRPAHRMICKRHLARVERGDCIAHLATDYSPSEV